MYRETINEKISESIKNKDAFKIDLWRAIKNDFLNYEKSKDGGELTDDVEFKIISKMIDQRKESMGQYTMAGRTDTVEHLKNEIDFLSDMLPKEATDEDIDSAIDDFMKSKPTGYILSMRDMKDAQAFVKAKFERVDGGKIAKIYKNKINF